MYISDREKIEEIIEEEFSIIERIDKLSSENESTFGYGALHYLVKIKESHRGPRYDDLKDLICEIQVRTILQDAWAIVDHHLSYKQESDIPKSLRRKLNALSGSFEIADDQFERIRDSKDKYQSDLLNENSNDFLKEDINLDSLTAFVNWKYPDREKSSVKHLSEQLDDIQKLKYSTLEELNITLDKTEKAFAQCEKDQSHLMKTVGIINISLGIFHHGHYSEKYGDFEESLFDRYRSFLED